MPVRYDEKYVKRPHLDYEYSPEEIRELKKCNDDLFHFIKYVKIINLDVGEMVFEPRDYQVELLDMFMKNRYSVALASRQSGKTTVVAVYILWYAIFNKDKNIGIVSNKEASAKMILARLKKMRETLPMFLKPGVQEYAKTGVIFDNNTRITVAATSQDAFRGEAMNCLVCDEFAFVPDHQCNDFWASNYPTVSSGKDSKIVIISTPNGMYNLFHTIYSQAEAGKNAFNHMKISYDRVPGRDEEWKQEQIKNFGMQKFRQEFAVEFLGSTNTVISADVLSVLLSRSIEPSYYDLQDRFRIYEKPVSDAKYILGCDPAKGTGENASVIQVLKIESINPIRVKQVAIFQDVMTDVYSFSEIINKLSYYYNNAYIMCENNGEGSAVIHQLWWNFENENLVNTGVKIKNLGIRSTTTTKPKAVLFMKKLIEDGSVDIIDQDTIEELASFIEEKDKFFGKDKSDDCVSALYWGLYVFEMNHVLDEEYAFIKKEVDEKDAWGILFDVDTDTSDDWSWLNTSTYVD